MHPEIPPEKSEAATVDAVTASKSHDHAYHDEAEESADNVASASTEGKDDDATGPVTDAVDSEPDAVIVSQSSNPILSGGGKPAPIKPGDGDESPVKNKRGRPAGSKNGSGKRKPTAKKQVEKATEQISVASAPAAVGTQNPGALRIVARTDVFLREPFSTLLPIQDSTYQPIKTEMCTKGYDPTHPVHLWDRNGELIMVDGHTRNKAAGEAGITYYPAFIHHFQDESEALGFAIKCQTERRNVTDGEMFKLVIVYDEKVKPGSTQQRQQGGTYAPGASVDAPGKSAKKTAKVLNTTTTNIERARYLHKHADSATKAAVTNEKMTLSRACDIVRKKLAAKAKDTKKPAAAKSGREDNETLPFELTPESEVAFAIWNPVVRSRADLPTDPGAEHVAEHQVTYVLADELLNLPTSTKKLGGLTSHRLLVSPGIDLFADEVPVKIIRTLLQTAAAAKQFQFLFTTSNPGRLGEFSWEANTFAGVSIFVQRDVAAAEAALLAMDGLGKWLVVEQLTMELTFKHLDQIDWLVVRQGAGIPGAAPDANAVKSLLRQAWAAKCPVLFERGINYQPKEAPKTVETTEVRGDD